VLFWCNTVISGLWGSEHQRSHCVLGETDLTTVALALLTKLRECMYKFGSNINVGDTA